ncbi:hypothetical protein Q8F77_28570, partial [Klebsiella pneumoniae]|nr:hypothetical protein [Klebsiella pneumoniae]
AELSSMVGGVPGLGQDGEQLYRLRVTLDDQAVTAYGQPRPLQSGMLLDADIFQFTRRLYEWVLEPPYSLTGKRQERPMAFLDALALRLGRRLPLVLQ